MEIASRMHWKDTKLLHTPTTKAQHGVQTVLHRVLHRQILLLVEPKAAQLAMLCIIAQLLLSGYRFAMHCLTSTRKGSGSTVPRH